MLFNQTSQQVDKSPLGIEMSESDRQRILRYATFWQFYLGRHWAFKREEGEPQMTMNYARAFLNKGINFLFGKGFEIDYEDSTCETYLGELLDEVWDYNNKKQWAFETTQMGSVSGDIFIKVAWEEPNPYNGLKRGRIRPVILDSSHCFPIYHPHNREQMIRFRIAYQYEVELGGGKKAKKRYTEIITPERTIILDDAVRYEVPNGLGFIPVVHGRNLPVAAASFGLSDLNDFCGLNREINEKFTNLSDIINYHEATITVVYGAKASTLEKGANKVWSNLPKDAKVENLQLQGDLGASVKYVELMKEVMHETMGVPAHSLGKQQEISNTSGVALHMQYMPLFELREAKMMTYGPVLEKVHEMIIRLAEIKLADQVDLRFIPEKKRYKTKIKFLDPLPKDRLIMLQEIQQRMQMSYPLITPPDALKMLGVEDVKGYLKEIELWKDAMSMFGGGGAPQDQPTDEENANPDSFDGQQVVDAAMPANGGTGMYMGGNGGGFMNQSKKPGRGAMQSIYNLGPGA